MSFNEEKMNVAAHIADAAYKRGNISKARELEKVYGERFKLIPEETDKIHAVFRDTETDKIYVGIRGTDLNNAQSGKVKDLLTDVAVTFGLQTLTSRYKKSDKKVKKLIEEYGKDNVILASHSLGGSIARDLVFKHDVESHAFNSGGSHLTFSKKFRGFGKKHKEKVDKNHTYFVTPKGGFDPLSVGTLIDLHHNPHFIEPKKLKKKDAGIIYHHSVAHFKKDT